MAVIKANSQSQTQILTNIMALHTGPIQADVTFGGGCFYKALPRPALCFDMEPRKPGVIQADVRHLPLKDGSLGCAVFDPPFLIRTGPGSNLKGRYGCIDGGIPGLKTFYGMALHELHRVIKPKGWLIFKCQDLVSGGKNHFIHCDIRDMALAIGYEPVDLFILEALRRQEDPQGRPQKHARKYHSFFWVFKKNRRS
jgi:hypothetical protein